MLVPSLSPPLESPAKSFDRSIRTAGSSTPTVENRPRPDAGCSSRLTGRMLDMHICGFVVDAGGVRT